MSVSLLITGGGGFVGQALLSAIAHSPGSDIKNLHILFRDRTPQINFVLMEKLGIKTFMHRVDLAEPWNLDIEVDAVINLAAEGRLEPYSVTSSQKFLSINENFVRWLSSRGNRPSKIVHASSGACYGRFTRDLSGSIIKKSPHGWEKSVFVESRIQVEDLIRNFACSSSIDLVIARLFTFSGIGLLNSGYAISRMIREAVDRKTITIESNPNSTRSYLDEKDLGASLVSLLQLEGNSDLVDIGSKEEVTLETLAHKISNLVGARVNIRENHSPVDYYAPSIAVTHNINMSKITTTWEQSLASMVAVAMSSAGGQLE